MQSSLLRLVPVVREYLDRLETAQGKIRDLQIEVLQLRSRLAAVDPSCPLRIIVGASGTGAPGWIVTEIDVLNLFRAEDWARIFAEGSIDAILAEHVWEHLTPEEAILAARNCLYYLRAGGYLRVAVPDGFHPAPQYIEWVRPGGTGMGSDDHKVLYTYQTLGALFASCGFTVNLIEYFDEQGQFHFRDWHPREGMIHRSSRYDERNRDGELHYTSLILDAKKV